MKRIGTAKPRNCSAFDKNSTNLASFIEVGVDLCSVGVTNPSLIASGKDRELRRLQDLHEAQARRDTKERAADDDRIRALAELVTRLRNGLAVTNDMLNNERQRSARFETELDACRELHRQVWAVSLTTFVWVASDVV